MDKRRPNIRKTYEFCGPECKKVFNYNPEKFLQMNEDAPYD